MRNLAAAFLLAGVVQVIHPKGGLTRMFSGQRAVAQRRWDESPSKFGTIKRTDLADSQEQRHPRRKRVDRDSNWR
jgi:hypothetical protein